MIKKTCILVIFMVVGLIAVVFTSCFSVCASFPSALNAKTPNNVINLISTSGDDIDRWAVIVGVSYYEHAGYWSGPMKDARDLAKFLKKDNRWNDNNIKVLEEHGENKKQHIINALDWLNLNADDGDLVFFFYSGHGGYVTDENGDEKDGKDEVICPFDTDWDDITGECIGNYISDDELASKFNEISNNNIKGLCAIFDCCFSGGLIENCAFVNMLNGVELISTEEITELLNCYKNKLTQTEKTQTTDIICLESYCYTTDLISYKKQTGSEELIGHFNDASQFATSFSTELTADITVDNSVLIASTLEDRDSIDIFVYGEEWDWISFGRGVCEAIKNGETTAEDVAYYAKSWYINQIMIRPLLLLQFILNNIKIPRPIWVDNYPVNNPSSAKLSLLG
jgi:hypothetical protein